jgi:hypothetical protein
VGRAGGERGERGELFVTGGALLQFAHFFGALAQLTADPAGKVGDQPADENEVGQQARAMNPIGGLMIGEQRHVRDHKK